MHLRLYLAFYLVLSLSIETAIGKDHNKTKSITDSPKKQNNTKDKLNNDRIKRSLDGDEIPFWPNRGRRVSMSDLESNDRSSNNDPMEKEPPFWGTRGRRDDSSSIENYMDAGPALSDDAMYFATKCKHCYSNPLTDHYDDSRLSKELLEEQDVPFWGNRGRRNSGEDDDGNYPFWGNRGRRQEDDPFWGARGRRENELPFWGNRGRRYSWGKQDIPEETPVSGNRGRRDEVEPFWGSRGRRESKNRRRENIKKILHDAINAVEDNIESLARSRRDDNYANLFWENQSRDSKISNLFKLGHHKFHRLGKDGTKLSESSTIYDDRIFAEQPHYILVERSSRSSSEDDPFYISRGKKMFIASAEYPYSARGRRGSLEDLVKSVRNDPYYIARGKKHLIQPIQQDNKTGNSSLSHEEMEKTKELICATIDLILYSKGSKMKREMDNNNDRDRRTILKKLAAQLQKVDPYFASRGKKNESGFNEDNLEDFINEVSIKCN